MRKFLIFSYFFFMIDSYNQDIADENQAISQPAYIERTRIKMSQKRRKPFLNRKETQSLLTTLKLATTAGALSLTIAGWGMLAQLDSAQAPANQAVALVTSSSPATGKTLAGSQSATQSVKKIDVIQWVQDVQGRPVAVVRDKRGSLWYVMGSDITRLEKGQSPLVQPQLVRTVTRTRAS